MNTYNRSAAIPKAIRETFSFRGAEIFKKITKFRATKNANLKFQASSKETNVDFYPFSIVSILLDFKLYLNTF